jgi:hypothetical protein
MVNSKRNDLLFRSLLDEVRKSGEVSTEGRLTILDHIPLLLSRPLNLSRLTHVIKTLPRRYPKYIKTS